MDSMDVTSDHHETPCLMTMPVEIISRISSHLNTTDLCSFRLTCRGLETAVFKDFAEDLFGRRQFMISEFSLGALCDIAKSRLGWYLKQLHIGLETTVNDPRSYSTEQTERQQRRCQEYAGEHLWMCNTGRVLFLLTEALRHLQNLECVVIRDFNSFTRYRDGPHEQWKSYGVSTMRKDCGITDTLRVAYTGELAGPSSYLSQVFSAVLISLGRANARPKAFKIYERKAHRLPDLALHIPPELTESIAPVLEGLKVLHLCIQPVSVIPSKKAFNNYFLRKFLALTPNLEVLRINSNRHSVVELGWDTLKSFHQWLAAPVPDSPSGSTSTPQRGDWWETQPPPVAFPKLRTLSLGSMAVNVKDLLAIIAKFASGLERLELWTVMLSLERPLTNSPGSMQKVSLWKHFLRALIGIRDLDLREIMIGRLRQHNVSLNNRNNELAFICEDSPLTNYSKQAEYSGPAWRGYVNGLSMMFTADLEHFQTNKIYVRAHADSDEEATEAEKAFERRVQRSIHRVRLLEYELPDDGFDIVF